MIPNNPAEILLSLDRQDNVTANLMEAAFASVRIPDVPELREAFCRALPVVRDILSAANI